MHAYHLLTIIILVTTFFTYVNQKFLHWPVTIAVTLFSFIISLLLILFRNYLPDLNMLLMENIMSVDFQKIVMQILLGFLLFSAAFKLNGKKLKQDMGPIIAMALFSTLLSTFIVGGLMFYTFRFLHQEISFLNCLLFGALISPTDPVAVLGVLRKLNIPERFGLKMTGESLINDGIAIVVFTLLLRECENPGSTTIFPDGILLFLREAAGGFGFGLLIGWLALLLLRSTRNYKVEILITLSVVMGGYQLAQLLGVSSPIAMVMAGLVCSAEGKKDAYHISDDDVITFWDLAEDLINVVLFLLIGVEVFIIPLSGNILVVGVIAIVWVLVSRFLSLVPVYAVFRKNFEPYSLKLLTWGALRGAVSIALVLSLPRQLYRTEFLTITYIIAVFSIIVQGLTIRPLAKRLLTN
ncbi:MAG: cation:proton antiporter [Flavisolibacter sp.]